MPDALITLELDDDVREDVCLRLVQNVRDAVAGAADRDGLLWELEDQLEGRLVPINDGREKSASRLNDPMSQEVHTQICAMLHQTNRLDPPCTVVANHPDDADNASIQEKWLAYKAAQYKLESVLYDLAYNTVRDHAGVLFVGWQQTTTMVRSKRYRDIEYPDSPSVAEDERQAGREYDEEITRKPEVEEGCEFRTPDLCDFYPYPANSQSVKYADGVCERMLLTRNQLLDGVESGQYEEEPIRKILAQGATHIVDSNGSIRANRDMYDGTSDAPLADMEDGFYECFLYFGRLPHLDDEVGEEARIPEHYRHDDIMAMVCPFRQIVFQLEISPFADRPYIMFNLIRRPNRMLGKGAMQLIAGLQDEANAFTQLLMDSANYELNPGMIVPKEDFDTYREFQVYPGCIWPEPEGSPNGVRPLVWGPSKIPGALEILGHLQTRAQGSISSEGFGVLQNKVRKNEEIKNVLSAAEPKFDLFLAPWNQGKSEMFARIVALHVQFQGAGLRESFRYGSRDVEVTAAQMRGRYRYVPAGSSTTINKQVQLDIAEKIAQVQVGYLQMVMQLPQFASLLWHGARGVLSALSVSEVEQLIGPEPPAQQQGGVAPQIQSAIPQVQALVQAGVPPQLIAQMMGGGSAAGSNGTGVQ